MPLGKKAFRDESVRSPPGLCAQPSLRYAHTGKRVAIAGAGLGGLAFGLSLLRVCQENQVEPLPDIKIFERDASSEARGGQGYSLAIRDTGGLQVSQGSSLID